MLTITEINDLEELAALRPEWDDLEERVSPGDPYLRFEYLYPWSRYALRDDRLRVVVAREGERVVGMVPLVSRRARKLGLRLDKIMFPTRGTMPGCDFLLTGDRERVVREAFRHLIAGDRWDVIQLVPVPDTSPHLSLLEAFARDADLLFVRRPERRGLFVAVEGSWEEYQRSLSPNTRKELKRLRRRMEEAGPVAVERCGQRPADVESVMRDVEAVTRRSWKWRDDLAPEFLVFLGEMARLLAARGWLDVAFLRIGGMPVAYIFGIRYRGRFFAFYCAYDQAFAAFGPGMLLMGEVLKEAFETGLSRCEFGTDWAHLRRWTHACETFSEVLIFNRSAPSRLFRQWHVRVKPIVERLRWRSAA